MQHYHWYIGKQLAHAAILVTLSLTSIIWLAQALRFIELIVHRGVSIALFLHLVILLIPSLMLLMLPIALFCAILFIYHRLMSDSEWVALGNAGLSHWQLAMPALAVGAAAALIGYALSLHVLPYTHARFKNMQLLLRQQYASLLLQEGVFSSPVDGLTVFIRERRDDNTLRGILVHDSRRPEAPVTMMAEEGKLVQTPQGPRFMLANGNRQETRNGRLSFLYFDSYALDISIYAKDAMTQSPASQAQSIGDLLIPEEASSPQEAAKLKAEGHHRLTWPLHALGLALLGLALLTRGEFNRRGQTKRVAFTACIGAAVLITAAGLRSLAGQHPGFTPLLYLNAVLPGILGWFWLREAESSPTLPLTAKK